MNTLKVIEMNFYFPIQRINTVKQILINFRFINFE